tara:strand:+ start:7138 stop:7476 length:339 start_codon:yes stop_codon:yes gene_type:complete
MIKTLLTILTVAALAITPAFADRTVSLDFDDQPGVSLWEVSANDGAGHWDVLGTSGTSDITIADFPDASTQIRVRAFNGIWGDYSGTVTVPEAAPAAPTGISIVSSVDNPVE